MKTATAIGSVYGQQLQRFYLTYAYGKALKREIEHNKNSFLNLCFIMHHDAGFYIQHPMTKKKNYGFWGLVQRV